METIQRTIQRLIEIPLEELQTEEGRKNSNKSDCCILCGKKLGKEPKMVHLLTNGNIISYNGDDVENSQGFFGIGKECAKKLIIQFAF